MSDLLTRLIEAGTPAALVAEVARELARAEVVQESLEARRSKDRERQARRRNNVMSRDNADVTAESPAPSFPPNPPITPTPVSNNTRARGSRLEADFSAPDEWISWAINERNWSKADAVAEAANFADFWHAKPGRDGLKLDWLATWRNWVRNSRRPNGSARDGPSAPVNLAQRILQREQQRARA